MFMWFLTNSMMPAISHNNAVNIFNVNTQTIASNINTTPAVLVSS